MTKFKKWWLYFLGVPKTIYFNLKYFPLLTAIKMPVLVSQNVLLNKCGGKVKIDSKINPGMIKLGFGYVPVFDRYKSRTVWNVDGFVIFKGNCSIGHGSKIGVSGTLTLGQNFTITAESIILCSNQVEFGQNALISWKCQFLDGDFHKIYVDGKISNPNGSILIGNNNWFGTNVVILKNTVINNNNIIAAGSVVNKSFEVSNCIIAGNPAKVVKENCNWSE